MRGDSTPAVCARGTDGPLYPAREAAAIVGVSRRRLRYWAKTGLVAPQARTPGGHHRYGFRDLVALKAAKRLLDGGVSLQRIRRSIGALRAALPRVADPLREIVLVATGDVVLVLRRDAAFEALSGQEWIFEVARFEREVADHRGRASPAAPLARGRPASGARGVLAESRAGGT